MSIATTVAAILTSLRAEGAGGDAAPWGARVHLRRTSDVVEVSGARTGEPVQPTWPMLLLQGPKVVEQKEHQHPTGSFTQNYNAGAQTVEKRALPRFYSVSFRVVWQCRSGFGTGTGPTATTAEAQSIEGIARFERWAANHRAIGEGVLFTTTSLGTGFGTKITPADLLEAVGEIRVDWVQEFNGPATVVATARDLVVSTHAVDTQAELDDLP